MIALTRLFCCGQHGEIQCMLPAAGCSKNCQRFKNHFTEACVEAASLQTIGSTTTNRPISMATSASSPHVEANSNSVPRWHFSGCIGNRHFSLSIGVGFTSGRSRCRGGRRLMCRWRIVAGRHGKGSLR